MSLKIEKLSKWFAESTGPQGPKRVLNALDLEFKAGQFYGLLGPSGCGKTTLLRIVAGLDRANEGKLSLDGQAFFDAASSAFTPPEQRNIGMVFQNYAVWPHMTVFENVAFPLRIRKRPEDEIRRDVNAMLETVQLGGLAERRPHQLSGGQQQRVALARALVQRPKLLLLDEPLSNLDAHLRDIMRKELRELQRKFELTAIIVTHDWDDASRLCDRVVVLRDGHIEQDDSPAAVFERPASEFVRRITRQI